MSSHLNRFLTAVLALAFFGAAFGQGVTTSAVSGYVLDKQGKPVAGATVTAVHEPSGTHATVTVRPNGQYGFRGMIVGGPYTFKVEASGFQPVVQKNLFTRLGEEIDTSFTLVTGASEVVALEKFTVEADRIDLDAGATGAGTVLDTARIRAQPTVFRSFADLTKINPFVSLRSGGNATALGQNNRFNSISVDGARINDQFGLSGTGLVSLNNPFSLEALEQYSVSLTPYDVRQSGFSGAAINVVTKRGTNKFSGSIYYIYTDAHLQGADVFGTTKGQRPPLYERTSGFTLGGPILKDRLFFFVNYEKYTKDTAPTAPGFIPNAADLARIMARLTAINNATTQKGAFGTFGGASTTREQDEKRLAKIDWNVSQDHRLSVRYSETVGQQPVFAAFNSTSFAPVINSPPIATTNGTTSLSSSFYINPREEKVWAGQFFSNWTHNFKTQLSYAKTDFNTIRDLPTIFPEVRIFGVSGTTRGGTSITNGGLRFGSENSSQGNGVKGKTETYGLNGDYFWRDFTFTAGVDREKNEFYNIFRQGSYGIFDYANLDNFENDRPIAYARNLVQTGTPFFDFSKFEQTGVFGQVKWDANPRLNLTFGLRVDYLGSPLKPLENTAFKNTFGMTNAGTIDGTKAVSPRFSFNYSLDRDRKTQLRGGLGVFLGRSPWVFFNNSFGNTGVGRSSESLIGVGTAPSLVTYLNTQFDQSNPVGTSPNSGSPAAINLVTPGIKFPTILRGNLAIDRKLPALGSVFTIEYIHTKSLQSFFIDNINLRPTTIGADGRQRFAGSAGSQPLYTSFPVNVLRVRNVQEGGSQYVSLMLDRPMKNHWAANVAYTHGKSTEPQAFGSSSATSNWQFNAVFNQNKVEVARSDYETKDRVQVSFSREFEFFRGWRTVISGYYEGRTGSPYSWVYGSQGAINGDLNTDGFASNDLFFVPTGPADSRFDFSGMTSAQVDAYFAAIAANGLSGYSGTYVPRNASLMPWQNRFDLSFVQEIPTIPSLRTVKLELFLDFLNFGSWIAPNFFNYIETAPNASNTGLARTLGTASYTATGLIRPLVALDAAGKVAPGGNNPAINNSDSRWRIQIGARLKF